MTFREFVDRRYENGAYMMCASGRAFIAEHNYNVRAMLTQKAARECESWDGPPAWCLLFWLRKLVPINGALFVLLAPRHPAPQILRAGRDEVYRALRAAGITQWEPYRKR